MDDLAAIEAIRHLNARYCYAFDDRDVDAFVGCFTADGVFEFAGTGRVLRGADEFRAAVLNPSHSGRHFTTDCLITVTGASASQRCQLIELGIDDEQPVVRRYGRYDDGLVRTAAGWRFASRRLEYASGAATRARPGPRAE